MNNKILIVDDEKDITLVLKEFFVSKGYDVLTAFNGIEAMGFLKEPGIDLILLDMQMPDIDGMEILKEAKKIYRDAKIVVLTGFGEGYRQEAEKTGCDAFLTKPFSVKTLIETVESVLAGKGKNADKTETLIDDDNILAKARLLFIEPNAILYSSKFTYFRDPKRCKGSYLLAAAFTEKETLENIDKFKPDIILSDIGVFRLYKLNDRLSGLAGQVKDIILYGLPSAAGGAARGAYFSFIGGIFDPLAAVINPKEMDKLGRIVRKSAIEHGLYIRIEK
ncbi:MAG: response regulator [Candidatus Omnitrophota bacterium]|jgi:CheY-like chemotaxis protein